MLIVILNLVGIIHFYHECNFILEPSITKSKNLESNLEFANFNEILYRLYKFTISIYWPKLDCITLFFIESRLNEAPSCIGGNSTNVSTNF